ncbi:MAG: hypothetical protein HY907_12545 [Deltaproteobacteria bacterium]|nr:hypothetical protein [Deltaproteobacteria bacterium]
MEPDDGAATDAPADTEVDAETTGFDGDTAEHVGEAGEEDGGEATDADGADGGTVLLPPVCGDRAIDPGEECDDGNRMNDDGCDWLCRLGDGSFAYPGPDGSVPPIESATEAMAIGPVAGSVGDGMGPVRVAWGPGAYGIAYATESPTFAMNLVAVDPEGVILGEPWSRPVPFAIPDFVPVGTDTGFGLLTRLRDDAATTLIRFDARASPIGSDVRLSTPSSGTDRAGLGGAVFDRGSFVVSYDIFLRWAVDSFSEDGMFERSSGLIDIPAELGPTSTNIFALDDGYAVADTTAVLVLDRDLRPRRWTGAIPGLMFMAPEHDVRPLTCSGDALFVIWAADSIWLAAVGLDGELLYPPRTVGAPVSLYGPLTIRAAWGPAGLGIAFSTRAAMPMWPSIYLANTDRWGNLISGPVLVFGPEDEISNTGSFELVADDTGYAVVAWVHDSGAVHDTLRLRRFVPAP